MEDPISLNAICEQLLKNENFISKLAERLSPNTRASRNE